jgi:hypothetical protein
LKMTTTAFTTAAGPILVIDLGKYKCIACVDHAAAEPSFDTVTTSRAEEWQPGPGCPAEYPADGEPGQTGGPGGLGGD